MCQLLVIRSVVFLCRSDFLPSLPMQLIASYLITRQDVDKSESIVAADEGMTVAGPKVGTFYMLFCFSAILPMQLIASYLITRQDVDKSGSAGYVGGDMAVAGDKVGTFYVLF